MTKKTEYGVIAISTLGMIISFGFASSMYFKGVSDDPFTVIKGTTTLSLVLYMITIICCTVTFIWIVFIFFTSYSTIRQRHNTEKCLYFCAISVAVITLEFVILLFSDYTSFFNTSLFIRKTLLTCSKNIRVRSLLNQRIHLCNVLCIHPGST